MLTRHNLQGIYAEGIGIDLPNSVDNVPWLVETLEPAASHERNTYINTSRNSDQKIMEFMPPIPLTN